MMRKYILYLLAILLAACSKSVPYSDETIKNDLRVPAYPLLMLHPHLRLWSTTDQLTEKNMIFTNGKIFFVGFPAGGRNDDIALWVDVNYLCKPLQQWHTIMKVGKESTPLLDRMKAGSNLILMINIGR